jgi:hypothetical protein
VNTTSPILIGHGAGQAAGQGDGGDLEPAHRQGLAVLGQLVEVPAVQVDAVVSPSTGTRRLRLSSDRGADADRGAGLVFQVAGGRQVVGVQAGLQDPGRAQVLGADVGDDRVDEARVDGLGQRIEIQHGVDDGAEQGGRIGDQIGHRPVAGWRKAVISGCIIGPMTPEAGTMTASS